MSKESFTELCSKLSPYISKKTTTMRDCISAEKQLAVALYDLMDEGRLRKVANAFGIAKSTVSKIVRRVSKTISLVLGPEYIKLPSTAAEVESLVSHFYHKYGFPQVLEAVDGTHVDIKQPKVKLHRLNK